MASSVKQILHGFDLALIDRGFTNLEFFLGFSKKSDGSGLRQYGVTLFLQNLRRITSMSDAVAISKLTKPSTHSTSESAVHIPFCYSFFETKLN